MKYEYRVYTSPNHSSYSKFTSKSEALRFASYILRDGTYALIAKVSI
jgi:hypothetical protein